MPFSALKAQADILAQVQGERALEEVLQLVNAPCLAVAVTVLDHCGYHTVIHYVSRQELSAATHFWKLWRLPKRPKKSTSFQQRWIEGLYLLGVEVASGRIAPPPPPGAHN